jgi:hypothetical protein
MALQYLRLFDDQLAAKRVRELNEQKPSGL